MAHYDPGIIQTFADRLYAQARGVIVSSTVVGIVLGAVGGVLLDGGAALGIVGALLGLVLGFMLGQARAFSLKLQAQTALCQMVIERNTRAAATARVSVLDG